MKMESQIILYDKKVASVMTSLSVRSLEYLIAAKELEVRRVGRRVLIPRKALEKFAMRDHPSPRPKAKAPSPREPRGGAAQ